MIRENAGKKSYVPVGAAVVFAVLYTTGVLMVGALPGIDKPGTAVVSHLRDHGGQMRVQTLLVTLGSLALVTVLGYARARLDGPSAYVFTIGSAMMLVRSASRRGFSVVLRYTPLVSIRGPHARCWTSPPCSVRS